MPGTKAHICAFQIFMPVRVVWVQVNIKIHRHDLGYIGGVFLDEYKKDKLDFFPKSQSKQR